MGGAYQQPGMGGMKSQPGMGGRPGANPTGFGVAGAAYQQPQMGQYMQGN